MTGKPPKEVDHRDMNGRTTAGRTCAPGRSQNKMNRGWQRNALIEDKACRSPTPGATGRVSSSRAWSGILGCFATPEEAHAVYMAAAREHFGEFVHA